MHMKNALISVYDKKDIIPLAEALVKTDHRIFSTGQTYQHLINANIPAETIESLTGFPEMMDGRIKTLHPIIHGGILAKRDDQSHLKSLLDFNIPAFDIVIVNLYPFKTTMLDETKSDPEIIEQIDIGGPAMIRSAAKNHRYVGIITDPADYPYIREELLEKGVLSDQTKRRLAAKAFRYSAQYDAIIANYLSTDDFPERLTLTYDLKEVLRYGENPHQKAAIYADGVYGITHQAHHTPLHGKPLSYNNLLDIDAAIEVINDFDAPTAVVLKHTNPCGIAFDASIEKAFEKAHQADPVSIFGGIVILNRKIELSLAKKLNDIFLEIVIAPDFSKDAFKLLTTKKNIRLIKLDPKTKKDQWMLKSVEKGLLIQTKDHQCFDDYEVPTTTKPNASDLEALRFAYQAVKHVKSNAIVIAKNNMTIGIGAGQMNRVGAARIAFEQAGSNAKGAYLASDGFFPMTDVIDLAAKHGIKAIIQPGGSIKDKDVIEACDTYGIAMVVTGQRHFKH